MTAQLSNIANLNISTQYAVITLVTMTFNRYCEQYHSLKEWILPITLHVLVLKTLHDMLEPSIC